MAGNNSDFSIDALLGSKLLTKAGKPPRLTKTLMEGKDLVALYFSASWCPPCKAFSPILSQFYNACSKQCGLEIVYVSSDRSIPDFESYYGKMPWLSIPTEEGSATVKNNLAQTLGISGIPTLVVIDVKTGQFVTASAREDVQRVGGNVEKGKELISTWKNMERKPLGEAKNELAGASLPGGPIMKILMFFARNPMYVFGLLYVYKWLSRKMESFAGEEGPATTDTEPPEESEF